MNIPDPNKTAQGLNHPLRGKGGEVAKRSNAADCKSAGHRSTEVRILPSPPEPPRPRRSSRPSWFGIRVGNIVIDFDESETQHPLFLSHRSPLPQGRTSSRRRLTQTVSHWAGVAQLVEHQPSKLRVAGPSPVSRSIIAGTKGLSMAGDGGAGTKLASREGGSFRVDQGIEPTWLSGRALPW